MFVSRFSLGAVALLLSAASTSRAQDIYLARITAAPGDARRLVVETPVNVTNRPGYDNQPSFTPDGRTVLYTSTREDQQADIWAYRIDTRAVERLTRTAPESEYSAAMMPDGRRFSVIRVERDSAQRLWSFALVGSDAQLLVSEVKPVGYHAWAGTAHIAMFVLGQPNTLQLLDTRTRKLDTIITNIGRSLVALPRAGAGSGAQPGADGGFSFVKRDSSAFALYTVQTGGAPQPVRVATLPAGAEYVAWLTADRVITGTGSKLFLRDLSSGGDWTELADLTDVGATRISRLAAVEDRGGWWVAVVAEPRAER
jgi:dipeptidyl aminopeptidase/acylaminoacyl peptidase